MVDRYSVISFAKRYFSSNAPINAWNSRAVVESDSLSFSNGLRNILVNDSTFFFFCIRNTLTVDSNYERMPHVFEDIFKFDFLHLP